MKKILIFTLLFLIISTSLTFAGEEQHGMIYIKGKEYKTYIIKKGDTLWDITSNELIDPFLWPKVWKENIIIPNPDRIYPGQKILIPYDLLQKRVKLSLPKKVEKKITEKKEEAQPEKTKLINSNLILSSGFITKSIDTVGKVIGSPTGRGYFGKNDYIYIKTESDLYVTFYAIRTNKKVHHPKSGKKLGFLVDILGTVKIIGEEAGHKKALITTSFNEISLNDLLIPFYKIEEPPDTPDERPFIGGTIVESKYDFLTGRFDFVYTDKGSLNGVKLGDLFTVYSSTGPKIPIGKAWIIVLKDQTSTAYITESYVEIKEGDNF